MSVALRSIAANSNCKYMGILTANDVHWTTIRRWQLKLHASLNVASVNVNRRMQHALQYSYDEGGDEQNSEHIGATPCDASSDEKNFEHVANDAGNASYCEDTDENHSEHVLDRVATAGGNSTPG